MRLLLDTHALLWALEDSDNLSPLARAAIERLDNEILVSVVSAWEIAIKKASGKLRAPGDLEQAVADAGFLRRGLRFADARRLEALPALHRDPLDRMLVAQALEDGIPIVSRDPAIAQYPLQIVW